MLINLTLHRCSESLTSVPVHAPVPKQLQAPIPNLLNPEHPRNDTLAEALAKGEQSQHLGRHAILSFLSVVCAAGAMHHESGWFRKGCKLAGGSTFVRAGKAGILGQPTASPIYGVGDGMQHGALS